MAKNITFTYKDKDYTLEYNRNTVIRTEKAGFDTNTAAAMPLYSVTMLFKNAFLMHHPEVNDNLKMEIYDEFTDKEELLNALLELYEAPAVVMLTDSASKNAIKWSKNEI